MSIADKLQEEIQICIWSLITKTQTLGNNSLLFVQEC